MKIPLFKIDWSQEDIDAVTSVIKRGSHWANGPEIEEFEDRLAYRIGIDYAVATNSGTSALHLVLICAGVKKDDEVIVPSFTFISTANAVKFIGAIPVFADIEKQTCGLDLKDVANKITPKTKVIIVVHYGGCPALHTKELKKLAEKNNIKLIEDSAAALGAHIAGKDVGTFGDFGIFSFCQSKIITAGEGGMIVTKSEEDYNMLKLLVSHGQIKQDYHTLGYNFRMSSMTAALGLSQLNRLEGIINKRIDAAKSYNYGLSKKIECLNVPSAFRNVYWIFPIRTTRKDNFSLMKHLQKNKIATKEYYLPVHLSNFYFNVGADVPNTEEIYSTSFCLPMYPTLAYEETNYVIDKVNEFYGEKK